ncbi:MAG TPA: YibE/F family protein, partial [Spirochaetota bacterium]|nr:YibE/F family protein [Spirochaetota bacterium]
MNIPRYSRIILTAFASLSVFISASFIPAHARESGKYTDPRRFMRAKVERIERNKISHEYVSLVEVKVHLRVLDGEDKGKERIAVYRGEDDMPRDIFYKEGDTVFIGISTMDDADAVEQVSIYDVDNSFGIIILGALLVACIALVGRLRGFFSILSLIATIVLIFYVMVPLTLKGHSPLPIAVGTALFAIAISVPIILGLKRKTIAAALGASVGVILAAA